MSRLVLTNANLIDAVTPGVTAGASVTVEDDRDNVRTLEMVFEGGRLVADHRRQ